MRVIFLVKDRQANDTAIVQFLSIGATRGHDVRLLDKKAFLASDLLGVDVVCLKSHIDDERVWKLINAAALRAVNGPLICFDRTRLDSILRSCGIRTPRSGTSAAEVRRLTYPIIQKSNDLLGAGDIKIFHQPPSEIDCERYIYQELIASDGATCKVYCIGGETFLVKEFDADAATARKPHARRQAFPVPEGLAEIARNVGRVMGLEVYGLDFVGLPDEMFLVDVNPFPSFRCVPRAADALWDYVEKIGALGAAKQ